MILPTNPSISANFLTAQVEPTKGWKSQNPTFHQLGHPVWKEAESIRSTRLERFAAPPALSHRVDDLLAEEEGDERNDDHEPLPHNLGVQLPPLLVAASVLRN